MVTIFTPVYNRAYIITKLYESLRRQTSKEFEWIIIDDGSTDEIGELVAKWQQEAQPFEIRFFRQENGGKHRAINKAVQLARYEAFFIVDSDDYVTDDAVAFINEHFPEVADDEAFAGISGLRQAYTDGHILGGEPLFAHYVDATNRERDQYNLGGDKAEIYKASVLKQYPFPEFDGENFIGEGVVWDAIADEGYKLRWYNKPIYMAEYLQDGLSRHSYEKRIANPKGWAKETVITAMGSKRKKQMEMPFFEYFYATYDKCKMCALLKLSAEEYDELLEMREHVCDRIRKRLQQNNGIYTLALYGLGRNAKRLFRYLKEIEISPIYGIDRSGISIENLAMYRIDDELPQVDSICITLKNVPTGLVEKLQAKMPEANIWCVEELLK